MAYFSTLPKLQYNFNVGGKNRLIIVKDIALNVRFVKRIVENNVFYEEYDIQDGETPEDVSEKFYKTPNYHWIIMIYNQRYDYVSEWPKSGQELDYYMAEKYPDGTINDQHEIFGNPHYLDQNGKIFYKVDPITRADISATVPFSTIVTNLDYELDVNEKKRRIKVVDSRLVEQIVQEFESAYGVSA